MSTPLRLAAVCLALPLALTACAGAEPDAGLAAGGQTPAFATSSPLPPAPGPATAPAEQPDDAQVVDLVLAGGKVSGDTGRVPVELGSTVRVTVLADVVDDVHIHGYDVRTATTVGQPSAVSFVADRPGVFEVELEEARVLLTRLQVQ